MSIFVGFIVAFILAILFPMLNKILFGTYSAYEQKNMMKESLVWFFIAGFSWGFLILLVWDFFVLNKIEVLVDLMIALIISLYGVFNGFILQLVGGLGTKDNKRNNLNLIGFNIGFIISMPISFYLYTVYNNPVLSLVIIYSGAIIGLSIAVDIFFPYPIFKKVQNFLLQRHGDEGSAKVMILLVILLLNAPWSMIVCYGLLVVKS